MRVGYPELSSPDPLADSQMEDYASRSSPRKGAKSSQRMRKSSDITTSSSEVVVDQSASPWRIKVTVQAEHEGDLTEDSGAAGRRTITRTMKIPLRDVSSPTKSPKKSSQPAKAKGKSKGAQSPQTTRSRRKSITDLDAVVLGDDGEEDEWTARPKSPRKKTYNKGERSKTSTTVSRKSVSDSFEIRDDERYLHTDERVAIPSRDDITPEMREVDLNQVALRARLGPGKQAAGQEYDRVKDVRKVSINSAASYPTPSPTASEYGQSDDIPHNIPNEDDVGLDTVMESEGFTMIDLDSLPSVKQMRNTPEHPIISEEAEETTNLEHSNQKDHTVHHAPSICLSTLTEEESDLTHDLQSSPPDGENGSKKKTYSVGHLQLPSSTNVYRHRHVTPMPYTSPSLPSPPRAPASIIKPRSLADSDKAVEAGMVLQDAVTPENSLLSDCDPSNDSNDKKEEALFGGFSSSTRRELRADLRFGEELGKKQVANQARLRGALIEKTQEAPNLSRPQVWRNEEPVQNTPPLALATNKQAVRESTYMQPASGSATSKDTRKISGSETPWETRARKGREQVIENVKAANDDEVVVIDSDNGVEAEELDEDQDEVDETMGDIWLAEARNHSSSPQGTTQDPSAERINEKPRRRLIPSPWKRGEQIEANSVSQVSGEDSFTGLFSRQSTEPPSRGFGAAIIANPHKAPQRNLAFDRRRSGEFADGGMTSRQPRRLSPRRDEDDGDQDLDDGDAGHGGNNIEWRDASDVIEEETSMLEATHKLNVSNDPQADGVAVATTHLYETNLEGLSEQDLSSSPHLQLVKEQQATITEHDSTYSSLSEDSTHEVYRQRTSLSPSKDRPNTPRSALKGGRASFGAALMYDNDSQEANDRKVVWAKRMSCMNEDWEESSRSIRSTQESFEDDTPTPLTIEKPLSQAREQRQHETSFVVDPQPPHQERSSKGWFGWFRQADNASEPQGQTQQSTQNVQPTSGKVANLDGSVDEFIQNDHDLDHDDSSYAPTSRHTSIDHEPVKTRAQSLSPSNNKTEQAAYKLLSSSSKHRDTIIPSYLKPPSCPSDPHRNPATPLSTSGPFTKTHFRTLHIIYRKSLSPRFHGPAYPDEIRPEIRALVDSGWKLSVDESETMDETFEFKIGVPEARTLERFMREVEHGYMEPGGKIEEVRWEWSTEDLAEKLGRIAVGEVVRGEEREAKKILEGARTTGSKSEK